MQSSVEDLMDFTLTGIISTEYHKPIGGTVIRENNRSYVHGPSEFITQNDVKLGLARCGEVGTSREGPLGPRFTGQMALGVGKKSYR